MEFSTAGFALLKRSEGLRLKEYVDATGNPTIGYGHKLDVGEHYPDGITEEQANQFLARDVVGVQQVISRLVCVPLTQGQYDALVDFTFNLGRGTLARSTFLKDINASEYAIAGLQILLWDHGLVSGHEVELAGLKARRQAELELWKGNPVSAVASAV